ncbi:MAG: PDZ domain-containing protein [Eubacteriales bacterium]
MFPIGDVSPLIIATFAQIFFEPFFWLIVVIVAMQYHRIGGLREKFFGVRAGMPWAEVAGALGYGILGGLAGSYLIVFVGLTLTGRDFYLLLPLAVLLMLFSPRFLCFSYSGGLLSLSNLAFGFPSINIPQIVGLVAVLHAVESVLILASGSQGAVPAYLKAPGGRVIGAFTLQKFWPIPIMIMTVVGAGASSGGVDMPSWWPLISPSAPGDPRTLAFTLVPVVAGLGYGDIAIARSPAEKSRLSALLLGAYSVILLLLALLCDRVPSACLAAALFTPLGHEVIIYIGRRVEFGGNPVYVPPARGVKVLDVLPGSKAYSAGIRSGDVILAVNGLAVDRNQELFSWLAGLAFMPLALDLLPAGSGRAGRVKVMPSPGDPVGIIPVPEGDEEQYVEILGAGPLGRFFLRLFKRGPG